MCLRLSSGGRRKKDKRKFQRRSRQSFKVRARCWEEAHGPLAHEIGLTAARPLVGPLGQCVLAVAGRTFHQRYALQRLKHVLCIHQQPARADSKRGQRCQSPVSRVKTETCSPGNVRALPPLSDKRGDEVLRKPLGTWSHDRSAPPCCGFVLTRQAGKDGSAAPSALGQDMPTGLRCMRIAAETVCGD